MADSEPEIEELEHRREVTKSGSKGTRLTAVTGDVLGKLAIAIETLNPGSRKNNIINTFNKLCTGYDQVIVSYVAKRDALVSANKVIETLRDTVGSLEKNSAEAVEKVLATRRGCSCRIAVQAGSMAGRCVTCTCAKANVKCSKVLYGCRCGDDCTRRESEEKEAEGVVKKRMGILKKKVSMANSLRELGINPEDLVVESEEEEEPERSAAAAAPKKSSSNKKSVEPPKKSSSKKQSVKRNDSLEEGLANLGFDSKKGKAKARADSEDEESDEESDEEPKRSAAAAAPRKRSSSKKK
jgi:hypothetical protein